MTKPRLLVVSVVHHADDTRIREKTLRTLAPDWDITYRTRSPAPTDGAGFEWRVLSGGRLARNLAALWALLRADYAVALITDPELLPAAFVTRMIRKKRVVFDVHEHIPGQIATKEWVPVRTLVSRAAGWMLRAAEPMIDITLAEAGYRELFAADHPVFPNYPDRAHTPRRAGSRSPNEVVYVGSVTAQRGIPFLLDVMSAGTELTVIGPCEDDLAVSLKEQAEQRRVDLQLLGRLPHREALERAATATVAVSPLMDIPNYRNSLPTKILEYLSLGLPVIASDLPGTRDVVGAEPSVVLVPPGDRDAWAAALNAFVGDGDGSARHGSMADSLDGLRWPAEKVRSFYEGLLEG